MECAVDLSVKNGKCFNEDFIWNLFNKAQTSVWHLNMVEITS